MRTGRGMAWAASRDCISSSPGVKSRTKQRIPGSPAHSGVGGHPPAFWRPCRRLASVPCRSQRYAGGGGPRWSSQNAPMCACGHG